MRERVYIKGGDSAWENLMKEMYLYPAFKEGIVEYKNGQLFKRALNYNRILGTIQFIDEKSDTLAIANEESVRSVSIGGDVFIYNPTCLQTISSAGKVKLFKNESLHIADIRQTGAYGSKNTSSAIESPNQIYTWMSSYGIAVSEILLLSKITSFYIKADNHEIIPAGKKNILKIFAKNEDPIKEFIKSMNINFTKESDLLELTKYLSQL